MCELCELKEDTDKKWKELEFRTTQYQVELAVERSEEARACKARAQELFDEVFHNLDKHASLVMRMESDSLETLLGKMN